LSRSDRRRPRRGHSFFGPQNSMAAAAAPVTRLVFVSNSRKVSVWVPRKEAKTLSLPGQSSAAAAKNVGRRSKCKRGVKRNCKREKTTRLKNTSGVTNHSYPADLKIAFEQQNMRENDICLKRIRSWNASTTIINRLCPTRRIGSIWKTTRIRDSSEKWGT